MNKEVENYRGGPTIQKLTSIRLPRISRPEAAFTRIRVNPKNSGNGLFHGLLEPVHTRIRLHLGDDERRAGTVSQKKKKEEDDCTLIYRLGWTF